MFLRIGNSSIRLKIEDFSKGFIKESDIENTINEKFEFEDKEVFKISKENNRTQFLWYGDTRCYVVTSTLNNNEILKFIENIKILKNF